MVFAYAIKYFKDHLLHHSKKTGLRIEDEICWVLTVPAIWDNGAKYFMRKAATEVSIINAKIMNLNEKLFYTYVLFLLH